MGAQGWTVVGHLRATNVDPAVWGPDALVWRPDRMVGLGGDLTSEAGNHSGPWTGPQEHAYCPQGSGHRMGKRSRQRCPGEQLTTLAINLLLLEVADRFDVSFTPDQDLSMTVHPIPEPVSGLLATVVPRDTN